MVGLVSTVKFVPAVGAEIVTAGGLASWAMVNVLTEVTGAAVPSSAFAVSVRVCPSSVGSFAMAMVKVVLADALLAVNVCVDGVQLPICVVIESVFTATSSVTGYA